MFTFASSFSFNVSNVPKLEEFPVLSESTLWSAGRPRRKASLKLLEEVLIAFGMGVGFCLLTEVLDLGAGVWLSFMYWVNLLAGGAVPPEALVAYVLATETVGSANFAVG